jgi:energy-coupling factor transporter transmembrane protein EcfT
MEYAVELLNTLGSLFGEIVTLGQFIKDNIIILIVATVVFAIAVLVLRSLFKILLFIPVLLGAVLITIWVVESLSPDLPQPQNPPLERFSL